MDGFEAERSVSASLLSITRCLTDRPNPGPESLSIDITFPSHPHVYGIPQHATNLSLPSTTGPSATYTDPYRLFNADVFEYLPDSPVSLYGSIPLMHAHGKEGTVAVFNAVGSDTWIDVEKKDKGTETHWVSESGILDVFILPGPDPTSIFSQYSRLTGTPSLPPSYSLAYHQCRWNYVSSDDVRGVQRRFDEEDMPVDVFWLDIEYSEGHKYFMWDSKTFPDPVEMIGDVEAKERKVGSLFLLVNLLLVLVFWSIGSPERVLTSNPRIDGYNRRSSPQTRILLPNL
jgi:alpha 1,3-glucosidase